MTALAAAWGSSTSRGLGELDESPAELRQRRAPGRVGVECPGEEGGEQRGDRRGNRRWLGELAGEQRLDSFVGAPVEHRPPDDGLGDGRAEPVDVAPRSLVVTAERFRCDVFGGECHQVGRGPWLPGDQAGDAEVAQLDTPVVVEQDVARLDVPVEDPDRVGGHQRIGHADPDVCRSRQRQRTVRGDDAGERATAEVLGHQARLAVLGPGHRVDGDDIGVSRQAGDGVGLAAEALPRLRIVQVVAQDLDGDQAVQ